MIEQTIKDRYFSLLRTCLARSEETKLSEAVELGRMLILAKVPFGEIAKMHEEALVRLANEAQEMTLSDDVRSTTAPLIELIKAYDMEFPEWFQSHYHLISENVTDVICTLDMNLHPTYISRSVERLIGYTVDEAISLSLDEVLTPSSFASAMKTFEEELAKEKKGQQDPSRVKTFEFEFKHKDGSTAWVETKASFLRDHNGQAVGLVGIARDVTERKQMEEELRAKEKMATIGEIAGGIAHEIKNPLFAISSGIQLLQNDPKLDEDIKKTLDIIYQEIMRVARLINQLLTLTSRQRLKRTPFKITTLINEVISLNWSLLRSGGIKIRKTLSPDIPPLHVERDRIIQVLVNILQNAIDVSQAGSIISIGCHLDKNKQCVVITVKDRGPGIPEDHREKIFDLFFSTKKGNSGLGLPISKRIILDHGGNIQVEPRKKGGSTFIVELPIPQADPGQAR